MEELDLKTALDYGRGHDLWDVYVRLAPFSLPASDAVPPKGKAAKAAWDRWAGVLHNGLTPHRDRLANALKSAGFGNVTTQPATLSIPNGGLKTYSPGPDGVIILAAPAHKLRHLIAEQSLAGEVTLLDSAKNVQQMKACVHRYLSQPQIS
jgi:hypothetical protein